MPCKSSIVPLLAAVIVAATAGCNAISGVGELSFEGGATSATGGGGAGTGSGGSSAATVGASGVTTSSSQGGGGSMGASTAAGPGVEICTNGADDDGDGTTDCDDDDCVAAAYKCVGSAGAVVAAVALRGGACPAGLSAATLRDCNSCGCAPTPPICEGNLLLHALADCSDAPVDVDSFGGTCVDFRVLQGDNEVSVIATVIVDAAGTCTPAGPGSPIDVCQAPGVGSCEGGGACVGPDTPCVVTSGPCPGGLTAVGPVHASDCGCTCAAVDTCPDIVTVYEGPSCTAGNELVPANGTCVLTSLNDARSAKGPIGQVTCTPGAMPPGGAPILCCP